MLQPQVNLTKSSPLSASSLLQYTKPVIRRHSAAGVLDYLLCFFMKLSLKKMIEDFLDLSFTCLVKRNLANLSYR